jgi:hypothetical protein
VGNALSALPRRTLLGQTRGVPALQPSKLVTKDLVYALGGIHVQGSGRDSLEENWHNFFPSCSGKYNARTERSQGHTQALRSLVLRLSEGCAGSGEPV